MAENKTQPTQVPVADFLSTLSAQRRTEAEQVIEIMRQISGEEPVMWGPSIIGFGTYHYVYATGREGDTPLLGFSPRKAALSFYILEGFEEHADLLENLGKHKTSVGCLYVPKLANVDVGLLRELLQRTHDSHKC